MITHNAQILVSISKYKYHIAVHLYEIKYIININVTEKVVFYLV